MFDYSSFIFEEHWAVFFSKDLLAPLPTEFDIISAYLQSTIFYSGSSSQGNFYGNISRCVLEEKLDFLKELYRKELITSYSISYAELDKRLMNFIKIAIIVQQEYSGILYWRRD